MNPSIDPFMETAERALRQMFPNAAFVEITTSRFGYHSGITDTLWTVRACFIGMPERVGEGTNLAAAMGDLITRDQPQEIAMKVQLGPLAAMAVSRRLRPTDN